MTGFQFETGPQEGTNRAAPASDCETCGGDRFVPVEVPGPKVWGTAEVNYDEAMLPCPHCNPTLRAPITEERRWEP